MDTMTWPAPTTDQPPPPPPPPPKKKISKGWIILALVAIVGIFGAISAIQEEAQFETDVEAEADRSFDNNVSSSGELDEIGYVRDACAALLDTNLPNTDDTIRGALDDGSLTVSVAADSFAEGYHDDTDSTTDLTRSEVISACASGLRNG